MTKTSIRCKICGDVITSEYRHDFKQCKCKSCYIDGGFDYTRIGFKDREEIELIEEEI